MEWSATGRIVAVRPHGETSAIIHVLTEDHGCHPGLVHGGRSRGLRPVLQPGNSLRVVWRARLDEHLGHYAVEPDDLAAGALMDDPLALSGLNAACAMTLAALPEREPHPAVHGAFEVLIAALDNIEVWPALYVRWELGLLADLGYGVDLTRCAATGARDGLVWVSPKTGRAVCAEAGEPYKDRLLPLPGFLVGSGAVAPGDIAAGLTLAAHFIERRVLWPTDRRSPEARARMIERLEMAGRL